MPDRHPSREQARMRGRKHLTNVLRIMSTEWPTWLKRGTMGYKDCTATKIIMV